MKLCGKEFIMSIKKLGTDGLEKVWKKVFSLIKLLTGDVDVSGKGTLQEQINKKADSGHSHSAATASSNGFMSSSDKSKLDGIAVSADSVSVSRNLTSGTKVGTITVNGTGTDLYAPTNTDTHYKTGLKVGASATAAANAAASNGNVCLNVLDDTTVRDSHKIVGSGATTVTSDANGVITIKSTDTNTTYGAATQSASGLMSATDKKKLDGISANANNYSHPNTSGNKHVPAGGSSKQILKWSVDGTAIWGDTLSTLENCAATHNGIFRGKDLTKIYTVDQICARISSGTFEDLYIGDYFDITITSEYRANEVVRCVLAGFDTYLHNGSASLEKHHAAIVPKNCFADAHQMNSTNTTGQSENTANASGLKAYAGSDMHNIVLPKYATAISNAIGSSHLIKRTTVLSNDMNPTTASCAGGGHTGASTGWEWYETYLQLLSEVQVYGTNVLSSSFFDTGESNLQLPLFKLDSGAKVCKIGGTDTVNASNRTWWWLKNVADSMGFCHVGNGGNSGYVWASDSCGVRPIFCIG